MTTYTETDAISLYCVNYVNIAKQILPRIFVRQPPATQASINSPQYAAGVSQSPPPGCMPSPPAPRASIDSPQYVYQCHLEACLSLHLCPTPSKRDPVQVFMAPRSFIIRSCCKEKARPIDAQICICFDCRSAKSGSRGETQNE